MDGRNSSYYFEISWALIGSLVFKLFIFSLFYFVKVNLSPSRKIVGYTGEFSGFGGGAPWAPVVGGWRDNFVALPKLKS